MVKTTSVKSNSRSRSTTEKPLTRKGRQEPGGHFLARHAQREPVKAGRMLCPNCSCPNCSCPNCSCPKGDGRPIARPPLARCGGRPLADLFNLPPSPPWETHRLTSQPFPSNQTLSSRPKRSVVERPAMCLDSQTKDLSKTPSSLAMHVREVALLTNLVQHLVRGEHRNRPPLSKTQTPCFLVSWLMPRTGRSVMVSPNLSISGDPRAPSEGLPATISVKHA
jgi:hypothetical protein